MNGKVLKRLIATVLTGGVLLSSTGVYTVMSYATADNTNINNVVTTDDWNESETKGNDSTTTTVEDTTSEDTTSNVEVTTKKSPETTTKNSEPKPTEPTKSNNDKPVINNNDDPDKNVSNSNGTVIWTGILGTSNMGSKDNPYAVSDVAHFLDMSNLINDIGNNLKYFKLTSNIDLSSVTLQQMIPAGEAGLPNTIVSVNPDLSSSNVFFILDGDNFNISNFNISDATRGSLGIVGYLNNKSLIEKVNFRNITINSTYSSAYSLGVVLKNEGTVSNCTFTDITVKSNSNNNDDDFQPIPNSLFKIATGVSGAIVDNGGTFTAPDIQIETGYNIKLETTGKRSYVGGIVSQNTGKIADVIVNRVTINAKAETEYVGGMVGANLTISTSGDGSVGIYDSKVTITKISNGNFVGGITGKNTGIISYVSLFGNYKSNHTNTVENTNILMNGGSTYGGITAVNTGVITNCSAINVGAFFSNPTTTTTVGGIYGGIAGTNNYLVQRSVATGSVTNNNSTTDRTVGGIVGLGSNESKFVISDCYSLVKLPETPSNLGNIVGVNGDAKYIEGKITRCFYSSIVSGSPSPTSYTGTGEAYGDLKYSSPVLKLIVNNGQTLNYSSFNHSGWGTGTVIDVVGPFTRGEGSLNAAVSDNPVDKKFTVTALQTNVSQTIYYGVNITLPAGIGSSRTNLKLDGEQLVLRTIQKSTGTWNGNGTVESPFEIDAVQQFTEYLRKIPYGHFKLVSTSTLTVTVWSTPITFWGSVDFNNKSMVFRNRTPLFKGVYGSRDKTMPHNDKSAHKSSISSDTVSNQAYGVIKNLNYIYADADNNYTFLNRTAIFGNICNATVLNINVTGTKGATTLSFVSTSENQAAVFNGIYGNSYLYGCNTDLEVTAHHSGQSAFISFIDAENAIIDNCGSKAKVVSQVMNLTDLSTFIGNIKKLDPTEGFIQNCYVSGGIRGMSEGVKLGNNCYLFLSKSTANPNIYNCYYSPSDYYMYSRGINQAIAEGTYTGSLSLWTFKQSVFIQTQSGFIEANTISNIDKFILNVGTDLRISNLAASFVGTPTGYNIGNIFMGSTITLSVVIDENAVESAVVLLTHAETGLIAKATIMTTSDLEMEGDYYLIKKPTDLFVITSQQGQFVNEDGINKPIKFIGPNYKFKLAANIDMESSGIEIDPWGKNSGFAFMGELTGDVNTDGTPKYTISGLKFSTNLGGSNGFFRYVNGGKIENIKIEGINVNGGNYVGGLIGQIMTNAEITNCHVNDSVVTGKQYVGGLIGGIAGDTGTSSIITGCTVNGTNITSTTKATDFAYVGGLIGSTGPGAITGVTKFANIIDCKVNTSNVYSPGYAVGGIVGFAANNNNVITGNEVNNTTVKSDCTSTGYAAVAGVAGVFGGNISNAIVDGTSVTGSRAAGVVSYLSNFTGDSATVSGCIVRNATITSPDVAAGIYSTIGNIFNSNPIGPKILSNCTVEETTNVTGLVAGGIFGSVYNYNGYSFTIDACKSHATVTSTGARGSRFEGAGAIVGRMESSLNTSGIQIKNSVAGGKVNGVSSLGGIIGLLLSNEHTSSEPLIKDSYIVAQISNQTLQSYKGLVVGYVGTPNSNNFQKISSRSTYSSYGTTVQPYGNVVDTEKKSFTDVNGNITAKSTNANLISGNETNVLTFQQPGDESITALINGIDIPSKINDIQFSTPVSNPWTSQYPDRVEITGNNKTIIQIRTGGFKARNRIFTTLTNTDIGVQFKVSFTVILTGLHKFSGLGTANDPYMVYDFEDLQEIKIHYDDIKDANREAYYSAHYVLANDIDCYEELGSQNYSFAAIGSAEHPFKGTLSSLPGYKYTISNFRVVTGSGNLTDGTFTDLSDNYALFGYTDGAEFSNINFENVTLQGGNINGALIGSAKNTSVSNITVTDMNSQESAMVGGIIGRAGDNVSVSNVSVIGDSANLSTISAQAIAGGIIGDATAANNVTISNATVEYAEISTTSFAGEIFAAGIAGAMSGSISNANVSNCKINSVYTAGIVGSGTRNNGNNDFGLSVSDSAVNSTIITSYSTGESSVAAGILAYARSSYIYSFENCIVDTQTKITGNYVAGGIVGKAVNSGAIYPTKLTINNSKSNADLTQTVTNVNETAGEGRYIAGVGAMIGLIGQQANMRNSSTNEGIFQITDSTAGGMLSGSINVGGIIGQIACQQLRVYQSTTSLIDNCIVTVSFNKPYDANLRFGVVIGCVETNMNLTDTSVFPDRSDYGAIPFNNIYYSSYTSLNFSLFGKTTLSQLQNIDLSEKVYDLNQARYILRETGGTFLAELPIGFVDYKNQLPSSIEISTTDFVFEKDFRETYLQEADSLFGFAIGSEDFVLDSITSSDTTKFVVLKNQTTGIHRIESRGNGSANLVFTYENGLQISLKIMSGISYNGTGDKENPIQVSSPEIFVYVVNILPTYYYEQTQNLDLKNYPITPMSNMNGISTPFSGSYNGNGYSINNLTVNGSSSDIGTGIFGTIEGALPDGTPNVYNLTFNNCKVLNGGSTTGLLAGKIVGNATGSPTIEDININNAEVYGTGSVGSVAGIVADSAIVENVNADNVKVEASSGGAGGLFGSIKGSNVQLNGFSIVDSTIKSGKTNENDVAGGIAAFASGQITGKSNITQDDDENDVKTLVDSVNNCEIEAHTSAAAIGAVYYLNAMDVYNLTLTDVKVSNNTVTGKATSAAGSTSTAAGMLGLIRADSEIEITNCYVDKSNTILADKYASGVVGRNTSTYFNALTITDTETYATVSAVQRSGTQKVFAGGIIAHVNNVNGNIITIDGSVAGGTITAKGIEASAGGAIGYMNSLVEISTALFTNGVLSASVFCTDGTEDGLTNAGTALDVKEYYGKLLAQFNSDNLVDNEEFVSEIFKDIFYSSYPQNIDFFGQHGVDSFQAIDFENEIPFTNVNKSSNFKISRGSPNGPWNSVAVLNNTNQMIDFHAKFEQPNLAYGNGKISTVDPQGFTSTGENNCIEISEVEGPTIDDSTSTTTYRLQLYATAYGATRLGAAYTCGLATSVPAISVDMVGDGSIGNPFEISTPMQLYVVGFLTAGEYYFKQINDIDLADTYGTDGINYGDGRGFSPIGTTNYPFQGVYDGQGHKITSLYMNRGVEGDSGKNIGLFGYITKKSNLVPTIKNLHVELMESDASNQKAKGIVGHTNVGGLVGYASNAVIENCSVAKSNVSGNTSVGGLVGSVTQSTITYSFVQSDVNAFMSSGNYGKAGGLVGVISNGLNVEGNTISNCFAMGNVYAPKTSPTSDSGYAGGIVGYIENGKGIIIENSLFTGTTSSGHGIYGDAGATVAVNVTSSIDAGQNTAMTNGIYAPVKSPVATPSTSTSATALSFSNVYYDKAIIKVENPSAVKSGVNESLTSALASGSQLTGIDSANWNYSSGLYPTPKTALNDSYSEAYALVASIPVRVSESQESDVPSDYNNYGRGIVYPVTLIDKIGETDVIYKSSIFDETDTVSYPEGFDIDLYGSGTNKNTDLLFRDNSANNITTVYRNIFRNGSSSVIVDNPLSGSSLRNGEIIYNYQNPVVTASFNVDGIDVTREIKIPLSYATTYCIATERQLFALGLSAEETAEPTSKFAQYYGPDNNYKLITDIVVDPESTKLFNPIGFLESVNDGPGYTGQFDGSGHKISNLKIKPTSNKTNVGMFATVSNNGAIPSDYSYIKNLIIENATVEGDINVGILAGTVKGNVKIDGCSSIGGSVKASGINVGGLIGRAADKTVEVMNSNTTASVTGQRDSVGGLIGNSRATIQSCYATGNVITNRLTNSGSSGIGGFIGVMAGGSVKESFAAGNVELKSFTSITAYTTQYGIGGFVGIVESGVTEISTCFSGGNVLVGSDTTKPSIRPADGVTATVGIGGFSGINYKEINNCYSSAAVVANFDSVETQAPTATIALGIGGVCGVAMGDIQNVYSSGSVARPQIPNFVDGSNVHYGVGGSIGTTAGNHGLNLGNCLFDLWTNTDSEMTSLGDSPDTSAGSTNIRAYTTTELTSENIPNFDYSTVWGHSDGAYPYLTQILNEDVNRQVRASAILSVIAVEPDVDDVSARSGSGITMALTVPVEFIYRPKGSVVDKVYNLIWSADEENAGVKLNGNKATPVRSKNISEYMVLDVKVLELSEYGSRTYERICADMRGTYKQPYLVGVARDLDHVGMNIAEHNVAIAEYDGLYDQWVTPLDDYNNPTNGVVYYQLMSNIDASESEMQHKLDDLTNAVYYQDDENIPNIQYEGMRLTGNGYSIQNITCEGPYINKVDEHTTITNILFENFNITGTDEQPAALIGTNDGKLYDVYLDGNNNMTSTNGKNMAGLVINNNGLIDGCIADVDISKAYENVATLVLNNNATGVINNSASAGKITQNESLSAIKNISGFVGTNRGTITNSFSMSSIGFETPANHSVTNVAGFCVTNEENATIEASYTRTAIKFANKPADTKTIAAFASKVLGTVETVKNIIVAGNLGYFYDITIGNVQNKQHSIAFGEVPGNIDFKSVYVDKAVAGRTSFNGLEYAVPTANLIELQNTNAEMQEMFVVDIDNVKYPQLKSIIEAENTPVTDENGDLIDYSETDEPVRNYDALKAYLSVSTATVVTANSQYIDALAKPGVNVNSDSTVSRGFTWTVTPSEVANIVSATGVMNTTEVSGKAVISASKKFTLARGKEIEPALNISIETGIGNPNFGGGHGTPNSPYIINNANSLQSLIYYGPNWRLSYRISGEINMKDITFKQIPLFSGKLEGQNNTIYNYKTTSGGLFGLMDGTSIVKDVALAAFVVNSTGEYTGSLADVVRGGTVENCVAIGTVNGVNNVGGLVGMAYNTAKIKNVMTSGKVNGTDTVGGVVGVADSSTIANIQSSAFVSATTNGGGIVGELSNSSTMSKVIFTGMANGPAKGSAIAGVVNQSSINDAYYDSQINISDHAVGISDENSVLGNINSITTASLSKLSLEGFRSKTGYSPFPLSLDGSTKQQFRALIELITMNLNFRSGSSKGSVTNYASITMQGTVRGDDLYQNKILAKEAKLVVGQPDYLLITETTSAGNRFVKVGVKTYDPNVEATGLKIILNSDISTVFKDLGDKIFRYIEPRMVRTVNISYTINNASGDTSLNDETVGVLIKNKYDDIINIVGNVNSFTKVSDGATHVNLDSISVSKTANGFYVGEMLPDGYEFEIIAKDGDGNTLSVSNPEGEYGSFVELGVSNTSVNLTINIKEKTLPWGIHVSKNTLNG